MSFDYKPRRGPEMERVLLDAAERLLSERAAKTGLKPRTLVNQIVHNAPDAKPTRAKRAESDMVAKLLQRLAVKDAGLQ